VTLAERQSPGIDTALEALTDTRLTIEDRAGAYAVLHQVQLRLNRALRKARDELIAYIEGNGLKALGPLSVKRTAIGVEWPCNAEANWQDATVQDTFRDVLLPIAPEFIRKVPAHYEIRTAELGKAVHAGDPLALQLHRELKARNWRTEAGRRLSLEVKEAK
jgi:hypothetical protein